MDFSQLELQQVVNSCFCMQGEILDKYVKGADFVEKSLTITKIATEIKAQKGTVTRQDIQERILR